MGREADFLGNWPFVSLKTPLTIVERPISASLQVLEHSFDVIVAVHINAVESRTEILKAPDDFFRGAGT
jgi:hypothetical protein